LLLHKKIGVIIMVVLHRYFIATILFLYSYISLASDTIINYNIYGPVSNLCNADNQSKCYQGSHPGQEDRCKTLARVYFMPFMSSDRFSDAEIGKIAWDGAIDGIKFSLPLYYWKRKIKFISLSTKADYKTFENDLQDRFWSDLRSGGNIKYHLKKAADRKYSDILVFGMYDGDDSSLDFTVYLYSKCYNVKIKKRGRIKTSWRIIMGLSRNRRAKHNLIYEQKALKNKIHNIVKQTTRHLFQEFLRM
ncbi:hypothetical protein TI05_08140, partial [Achromatium sp. WMS3]